MMKQYDFTDLSSIIEYLKFKYNTINEILEKDGLTLFETKENYKGQKEQLGETIRILKIYEYSQKQKIRGERNGRTNKSNTI